MRNVGMNNEVLFFDTYAIIEIIRGNPKYKFYENSTVITTIFNLAELDYNLRKDLPQEKVDEIISIYKDYIVLATTDDLKSASNLKLKNKQMSLPDTIGYSVAKRYNIKFLTGDEAFKDLPNVEFVKK